MTKPVEIKTYLTVSVLGKSLNLNINFKNINVPELDMNEKYLINVEEKTRIGKKAASFIQDNSLIYIIFIKFFFQCKYNADVVVQMVNQTLPILL